MKFARGIAILFASAFVAVAWAQAQAAAATPSNPVVAPRPEAEKAYQAALAALRSKTIEPIVEMNTVMDFVFAFPEDRRAIGFLHGWHLADNELTSDVERQAYQDALAARLAAARLRTDLSPEFRRMLEDQTERQQLLLQMRKQPLELKFIAADGREVDLAKLRGKVVLIDCWATWCVPCKKELPNIKRVYAEYHDKGFEVVGITLEEAKVLDAQALLSPRNAGKPLDTAEQAAAKLKAAKDVLLSFVQENELPWPQYFDGQGFDGPMSRRFQVGAIPKTFLLNQQGLLVDTDAKGERLEMLVKRLLKTEAASN